MRLYISEHPRAAVLATDENQARVLLRERLRSRNIRAARFLHLTEVSTRVPRVLLPPPPDP